MPSLGFLTLDIIILVAIAVVLFFLSYSKPKLVIKSILVLDISILVFTHVPYLIGQSAAIIIGAFVVLFVVISFLLRRALHAKRIGSGSRKFFNTVLLTAAGVISLLILYYHILPIELLYKISLPVEKIFTGVVPLGAWYLVPILVIFFVARDED